LVTLTLRHAHGQNLDDLFDFLGRAWAKFASGRTWNEWKKEGLEFVRGYDITHSHRHGWHPHLHLVLLLPSGAPCSRPKDFLERWVQSISDVGGSAQIHAQHVELCDDIERSTKYAVSLAGIWETVGTPNKSAKSSQSRTAFDLARDAVCGDTRAAGLWMEYAIATRGKRACTTSKGLTLAPDTVEEIDEPDLQSGEKIEDEKPRNTREIVAVLSPGVLRKLDPHLCEILRAISVSADEGRAALTRAIGPPGSTTWRLPRPSPS